MEGYSKESIGELVNELCAEFNLLLKSCLSSIRSI